MTFRVGQNVVCVDARSDGGCTWDDSERPVLGNVYTILRSFVWRDGEPVVHLVELRRSVGSVVAWGADVGYRASRFRPVIERATDIGFAHEILRKASRKDRVCA